MTQKGWYALWADQSRYYDQAKAISQFHLSKDTFYYPILYPLLGSVFINIFPKDPFLPVNAFLFLSTIALTFVLLEKFFNRERAIFGVLLLLSLNRFVYDFVTPWTTSLTTPLFLAIFFIVLTKDFSQKRLALISFLTGLAVFARYTDIFFFLPLIAGFIAKDTKSSLRKKLTLIAFPIGVLACFGFIFLFINLATSGSILGPYINRITSRFDIELAPLTIFEKMFGFLFNSFLFHRQIEYFSMSFFTVIPLALFLLPFGSFLFFLVRKEKNAIIHGSVFASFLLWLASYVPYGAIAPYTLKNLALHYAKPWLPVIIFYVIYCIHTISIQKHIDMKIIRAFFFGTIILLFIPIVSQKIQPKLLSSKEFDIKTTVNQESARFILDNQPATFWNSQQPRKKNDVIFIDMKKEYLVSRLQLIDKPPYAATNFDTFLSVDGKTWKKLAPNYTYNVRLENGWDIVGYMKKARYIKLILNEESLTDAWIIGELYVFGY